MSNVQILMLTFVGSTATTMSGWGTIDTPQVAQDVIQGDGSWGEPVTQSKYPVRAASPMQDGRREGVQATQPQTKPAETPSFAPSTHHSSGSHNHASDNHGQPNPAAHPSSGWGAPSSSQSQSTQSAAEPAARPQQPPHEPSRTAPSGWNTGHTTSTPTQASSQNAGWGTPSREPHGSAMTSFEQARGPPRQPSGGGWSNQRFAEHDNRGSPSVIPNGRTMSIAGRASSVGMTSVSHNCKAACITC